MSTNSSNSENVKILISAIAKLMALVGVSVLLMVVAVFLAVYNSSSFGSKSVQKSETPIQPQISTTVVSAEVQQNTSNPLEELLETALIYFKPIDSKEYIDIPESKIALGQKLYYDKRLSKDGNISCNTCHNLASYGVDNLPTSLGDTNKAGDRNSPTVVYASLHSSQFWDGRAKDVEEQAGMPILNPVEHNIPNERFLEERLRSIKEYQELFAAVYPESAEPVTFANLQDAIGAFERQLNPVSRFDHFLNGDTSVLNKSEIAGMNSFIENGCTACHSGISVGGTMLQKFGLYGNYWEYTKSEVVDEGLYARTQKESDKYVFKSPGLRNITKTYPYFHDGSVESLHDAVRIMGKLQRDVNLTDQEINNIVAFMGAMTAEVDQKYIEIE